MIRLFEFEAFVRKTQSCLHDHLIAEWHRKNYKEQKIPIAVLSYLLSIWKRFLEKSLLVVLLFFLLKISFRKRQEYVTAMSSVDE